MNHNIRAQKPEKNIKIQKHKKIHIELNKKSHKPKTENGFVDNVKIKEKIMTQLEIDNIDHIVLSWRFSMCVICANTCMAESLYDLSLSSKMCHGKGHEVPCRTSILKGYGNLKAAVEYINALRKYHCDEHFEAKYHAQNAIKISKRFEDNLNLNIRKLGFNILEKLKTGKLDDKSFTYFTLSELIEFSKQNTNYKPIQNNIGMKIHTTNIEYLKISDRSLYNKNTDFKVKKIKRKKCNKNSKKIAKHSTSENARRIIENNKKIKKNIFQNKKNKKNKNLKKVQTPKVDKKFHKVNTGQKIKAKNAKIIKNTKTKKNNLSKKQNIKKTKCLKCEMDKKICMCNEIEKIDNIVMSWRFAMCVSCACKCKGESFDDLYESSNYCNEQCHSIIHPTTSLHITGKFSAAVAYINACRMYFLKHYMDARYYLEEAILKSCAKENKVNAFVSSISTVLLSKINEMGDISKIQFPSILTLSEILATSENFTFKNKKCSKSKRLLGNDVIMKNNKDTLKKRNNNKNSLISKEKSPKNKRLIKIIFSKAKTIKNSLTFSEITKRKLNKTHVLKNLETKKFNKALVIKLDKRNSNEKSINEGNQISNKYYGNDLCLLFGGTHKRKRKRVDYTKLNNCGFDISCSQKRSKEENHTVSRRTEKVISESLSKHKKDDFKTDSNCKKIPLNSSIPQEIKLMKKVYNRRKNDTKPKNKVINAHEKHFTTKMTTVSSSISLEQKESSFISENIIQKIPINELLYKDKKLVTLNEDSDWDPEKHKCSTKKKKTERLQNKKTQST